MNLTRKPFATAAITALLILGGSSSALASSSTIRTAPAAPAVPVPGRISCKELIKLTQDVYNTAKEMDANGEDSTSMRETGDWLIDWLDEKGCVYRILV